jgi:hypothetical protein
MAQKRNSRNLRIIQNFNGINPIYADVYYDKLLQYDWNNQIKFLDLVIKSKRFRVIKAPSRRRRQKSSLLGASIFLNHLPYKNVFAGIFCKHLPKIIQRQNLPYVIVRKKRQNKAKKS